ncbi:cystathionine beta-lyase, partial [Streptomyces goshikiensis]
MKKLSARRRHPLAAVVVLLFALAVTGGLYAAFAPAGN